MALLRYILSSQLSAGLVYSLQVEHLKAGRASDSQTYTYRHSGCGASNLVCRLCLDLVTPTASWKKQHLTMQMDNVGLIQQGCSLRD